MTVLLPYVDVRSLRNLSKVNKAWNEKVRTFLRDFNKVAQVDVLHKKVYIFLLKEASKLVRLELNWALSSQADSEKLIETLKRNPTLKSIDITPSHTGWISKDVVETIALSLPRLTNVCLNTSRVRLFLGNGDYRKLWPHTCWNSRRVNREDHQVSYSEEQLKMFAAQVRVRNEKERLHCLTAEHQLLCCLRLLHSKCRFTDLALISGGDLMEPLVYHEYKCPKGLFYDRDQDSDESEVEDNYWNCSLSDSEDDASACPGFVVKVGQDIPTDSGEESEGEMWACRNMFS